MNTKQFFFLVALYCALHLTACYFQWRDRQGWRRARQTFTLRFDFKGVHGSGDLTLLLSVACSIVWFIAILAVMAAVFIYTWRWLA